MFIKKNIHYKYRVYSVVSLMIRNKLKKVIKKVVEAKKGVTFAPAKGIINLVKSSLRVVLNKV